VSLDDDIHVTKKVKGFILPQCYCMKTHHHPNRIQIDMPTEKDQIQACHCMSLPIVSQSTRYCLQAGYGLACAVANAEMALFAKALSLGFDDVEASSFAVR
jgi:hypothetical protein